MHVLRRRGVMNELALFAGAGGGILGGRLLGRRTICAVELDSYAASVLVARQNDGCLEPFPIWDDITTFDGEPWRGRVDVVSGGFPCQDISVAGKGAGLDGERSGLWGEMARVIREVRPRHVFVENSPRPKEIPLPWERPTPKIFSNPFLRCMCSIHHRISIAFPLIMDEILTGPSTMT